MSAVMYNVDPSSPQAQLPVASPVEVLQAVARQRADAGVVAGELVMQALQGEPGHELAITGLLLTMRWR